MGQDAVQLQGAPKVLLFLNKYVIIVIDMGKVLNTFTAASLLASAACSPDQAHSPETTLRYDTTTTVPAPETTTTLGATAIDIGDLSEPLPAIVTPGWPQPKNEVYSAHRIFDYSGKEIDWRIDTPEQYQKFFTRALSHSVVEEAFKEGLVTQYSAEQNPFDNGFYTSEGVDGVHPPKSINFTLSDGHSEKGRIYKYGVDIMDVTLHETGHAIAQPWYQYIEQGKTPKDPILAQKINALEAACTSVRDTQFSSWLTAHKDETLAALAQTGDNFQTLVNTFKTDGDLSNDNRIPYIERAVKVQTLTAQNINKTAPTEIVNQIESSDDSVKPCDFLDVIGAEYATPGLPPAVDNNDFGFDEYDEQLVPLIKIVAEERADARDDLRCIDESKSEEQMLANGDKINGGHSFDNPTEFAASLTAIIALNPQYLEECFNASTPEERGPALRVVMATIDLMQYTTPDIYKVLVDSNPKAGQVISDLSSLTTHS